MSAHEEDAGRQCPECGVTFDIHETLGTRDKAVGPIVQGTWPKDCPQRAFVEGAAWWMYRTSSFTPWRSERQEMEQEAIRRFGEPR